MSLLKWSITLGGVALAAAAFLWVALPSNKGLVRRTPPTSTKSQAQGTTLAPGTPLSPDLVAGAAPPLRAARPASMDYKKSFQSAKDYRAFAQAILPAAKAGNADAQLYLWKVLDYCRQSYGAYFTDNDGKPRSLDAGLRFAAEVHTPMEEVQSIYDGCRKLEENPTEFGNAMRWLAQATQAGQPVAQAATATLRLDQDMMKGYVKAGAQPTELTTAPPIGGAADPRELLRAAVESRDPEVLVSIGQSQGLLNPSQSKTDQLVNQVAWRYVACQRGLGCPANGAGSIGELMEMARDNWPAVQQRAQEINSKLDAGQWDELGLGS
jgi:hypothetical protein